MSYFKNIDNLTRIIDIKKLLATLPKYKQDILHAAWGLTDGNPVAILQDAIQTFRSVSVIKCREQIRKIQEDFKRQLTSGE